MHFSTSLFAAALLFYGVSAQEGDVANCNTLRNPDIDACDAWVSELGWQDNWDDSKKIISPGANQCVSWNRDDRNCALAICFDKDDGLVYGAMLYTHYTIVRQWCLVNNAGGFTRDTNQAQTFEAYQNGNFVPPSAKVAAVSPPTYGNWTKPPVVTREVISREELASRQAEAARQANPISRVRRGIESAEKREVNDLAKRQKDGDNSYQVFIRNENAAKQDGRIQVVGARPAGSSYTITQTDTRSWGISSTVEVGASFFEIFSTSVSLTVSQDYSVSTSVGETILIDCPSGHDGVLYVVPLYTEYIGAFQPSDSAVNFWIPVQGGATSYNYQVDCLG